MRHLAPCLFFIALLCAACAGSEPAETPSPSSVVSEASETDAESPTDIDALTAAVEASPSDAGARRSLAIALHSAGRKADALIHFEQAAEIAPSERSLLDLALGYASVSRFEEAKATYHRLLDVSPDNPIALHNLGNLALSRGSLDEAIAQYQMAIEARPGYLLAFFNLGDALRQAERYKESYRAFESVLTLEPTNSQELKAYDDALYNMATLDLMMGATERALQALVELIRANPEHPNAHYALGQALQRLGRTEDAQREFDLHMRLMAQREPTGPVATRE